MIIKLNKIPVRIGKTTLTLNWWRNAHYFEITRIKSQCQSLFLNNTVINGTIPMDRYAMSTALYYPKQKSNPNLLKGGDPSNIENTISKFWLDWLQDKHWRFTEGKFKRLKKKTNSSIAPLVNDGVNNEKGFKRNIYPSLDNQIYYEAFLKSME